MTKEIVLPTSPADLKTIKTEIEAIDIELSKIDAAKAAINDMVVGLSENYEIPKSYFSKMAKTFHNQNFDVEAAKADDFAALYVAVTGAK